MKNFILIATGEDENATGVIFIEADNADHALQRWLSETQDFEVDEESDQEIINDMMENNPVGIAEITNMSDLLNPELEWYYSYENIEDE